MKFIEPLALNQNRNVGIYGGQFALCVRNHVCDVRLRL